jgi:hypothetical protein
VAAALAFTGPGTYSVDHAIGFTPGHVISGLFAVLLGVVVGLVVFVSRKPEERLIEEVPGTRRRAA